MSRRLSSVELEMRRIARRVVETTSCAATKDDRDTERRLINLERSNRELCRLVLDIVKNLHTATPVTGLITRANTLFESCKKVE